MKSRNDKNNDDGFVQLLIIIVLLLVIISLLGVSVKKVYENELIKENFSFSLRAAVGIWDEHISPLIPRIWDFFMNMRGSG